MQQADKAAPLVGEVGHRPSCPAGIPKGTHEHLDKVSGTPACWDRTSAALQACTQDHSAHQSCSHKLYSTHLQMDVLLLMLQFDAVDKTSLNPKSSKS